MAAWHASDLKERFVTERTVLLRGIPMSFRVTPATPPVPERSSPKSESQGHRGRVTGAN